MRGNRAVSGDDVAGLKGKGVKGGDQIIILNVIMPKEKSSSLEDAIKTLPDENIRTF
jgi:hypothetical protein